MYQNVSGFNIVGSECTMIENNGGAPTYGEITYDAAHKLLTELNLNKEDVFYDFRSGVGKMVVQAYLTTPIKKSVDIELSPTRVKHEKASKKN
jgi:Histone methylation protein DOT1